MRIIHIVIGKANPESLNGISRIIHGMATAQHRQGHRAEIWGLADSVNLTPRHREYVMRVFKRTPARFLLGRELQSAVDHIEPGTWVQFHSGFTPEYAIIARQLRARRIAYGISAHGGYHGGVLKKNPWKKHLYFALWEKNFLGGATWVHTMGPTEVEDVHKLAPDVRAIVIPSGQEAIPVPEPISDSSIERPLIGYCGRLTMRVKGLDLLIRGFSEYKTRGGKGHLWLIGDGEDRAALEAMAAEGGSSKSISFLGAKFGQEKNQLVASVDAFIHSSRWDALPTACLEAAALGRPLLVSPHMNIAEYVRRCNAGLLLNEASAEGVLRALERVEELYRAGRLQELGDNGRRLIEREFSWEENAARFVAAIEASFALA
jgi:glycosyltransferase involved in cell wall biosynthesis